MRLIKTEKPYVFSYFSLILALLESVVFSMSCFNKGNIIYFVMFMFGSSIPLLLGAVANVLYFMVFLYKKDLFEATPALWTITVLSTFLCKSYFSYSTVSFIGVSAALISTTFRLHPVIEKSLKYLDY